MGGFRLLFCLALAASSVVLACANSRRSTPAGEERRVVTLALPRPPAPGETVILRVTTGALPRGARVVVRLTDGEVLGAVSPFGVLPGRKAGPSMIPLPEKAMANGKVQLVLEVEEKGQPPGRAPTRKEVEAVDLVFVPVTGQ
jgi:hypothetical protein